MPQRLKESIMKLKFFAAIAGFVLLCALPALPASALAAQADGAFSIKYAIGEDTYVITISADENRKRLDYIRSDGTHEVYLQDYNNNKNEFTGCYRYVNGKWENSAAAIQTIGKFTVWKSLHLYYKDAGFTKASNTTIAGQECTVWTGVPTKIMNVRYRDLPIDKTAEIAVWSNKATMRLKSGNTIILEAKAISLEVPDAAFTQTVEISWIK
jgi:hypothetical protein